MLIRLHHSEMMQVLQVGLRLVASVPEALVPEPQLTPPPMEWPNESNGAQSPSSLHSNVKPLTHSSVYSGVKTLTPRSSMYSNVRNLTPSSLYSNVKTLTPLSVSSNVKTLNPASGQTKGRAAQRQKVEQDLSPYMPAAGASIVGTAGHAPPRTAGLGGESQGA